MISKQTLQTKNGELKLKATVIPALMFSEEAVATPFQLNIVTL